MRRASYTLLSHLTFQHNRPNCYRIFSRDFFSEITHIPIKEYPLSNSHAHIQSCNISKGFLLLKSKTQEFQNDPSRNLDSIVGKSTHLSSNQRKIKNLSDIEDEFESATTTNDILKALEAAESILDENDIELGAACLKAGFLLQREGNEFEKTLELATRALNIFDKVGEESFLVAMAFLLTGSSCYSLKRFNASLRYLNRAKSLLEKLEPEEFTPDDIRGVLLVVHHTLWNTNMAMGQKCDALINHKRCLELKEMILEPNDRELGKSYRELAESYVVVSNLEEALQHCLKALEIHEVQLGENSVEVAHDRRLLGRIYHALDENQKALEQSELSQKLLKNWDLSSDLILEQVDGANIQISLGKYDEAINTLKGILRKTDKESKTRVKIFTTMANALWNQNKFVESKRLLEISFGILKKKESKCPCEVAEAYMDVAMLYGTMNELETAVSVLKRLIAILDKLPQEKHLVGVASKQIGLWLLSMGQALHAVPYLEKAMEMFKESLGSKHFSVVSVYNKLGEAYLELDRPQSAAQMFALAKDIMEISFGPHHAESIEVC